MAQPTINPKIEELRFRLKADPKSRLFYPLAEELRKAGQFAESEQVLRGGLASHPTYLSAWVSLGRVLRDQKKDAEAAEALAKALQLDPGNVVAARLLGDSYLSLGDKLEAIKKYKLVQALLPGDEQLAETVQRLDDELNAPAQIPEPSATPEFSADQPSVGDVPRDEPFDEGSSIFDETDTGRVFDRAAFALQDEARVEEQTADIEPMRLAHAESPFEEPAADAGYSAAALAIENPGGFHVDAAPLIAEVPASPELPEEREAEVFAPAGPSVADDFAKTITMADLYAKQGLIDEARDIYEDILARDPGNDSVRAKMEALPAGQNLSADRSATDDVEEHAPQEGARPETTKVDRLQNWLARVKRNEAGGV